MSFSAAWRCRRMGKKERACKEKDGANVIKHLFTSFTQNQRESIKAFSPPSPSVFWDSSHAFNVSNLNTIFINLVNRIKCVGSF